MRGVVLDIKVSIGRRAAKEVVQIHVVTGAATVHKNLAGMVADEAITKFDLPEGMPYESVVVIGLQSLGEDDKEEITVVNITHGSQEKPRMRDGDAYELLQFALAAVIAAMRRGRATDTAEPSTEPHDMDQLPEPIIEEFTVTREMVAEYKAAVEDGTINLIEDVSHSAPSKEGISQKLGAWLQRLSVDPEDL